MEKVPFMDLEAQNKSVEGELRQAIDEVVNKRSFINGPAVQKFNDAFLKLHGAKYGVGCSNGTSAITVALRALGVGHGDEVLIPNHTFIATAEAVVEAGATPVLVDIDEEFHQMDLKFAEKVVSKKCKAMIPVHLYGLAEPMDQVMAFAKKHGLKVVEDCAQAVLGKWNGQPVGTFGDLGTVSFYPGKNLGAFGDAGFIMTQDLRLFDFVKRYIDHGRQSKYVHDFFGSNYRIDSLQAAVLNAKLPKLSEWTERRRQLAAKFDAALVPKGFKTLKPRPGTEPVYHLYVVEASNRDEVIEHLNAVGVGCGVHYPVPLSLQPAFEKHGYKKGQLPVSENFAKRILSLAFYPEMSDAQVATTVTEFLRVAKP